MGRLIMMLKTKLQYIIVTLLLLNCFCGNVFAQEKVLITTDRDKYIVGEDLWFTVGVYQLDSQTCSDLSKVVYVEFLNDKNIPVAKCKCNTRHARMQSRIILPDTISTGNYKIRAYTRWMKNKDVSLFATKSICIINPFTRDFNGNKIRYYSKDTIFTYPESGYLFPGVENKILIRSVDKFGVNKKIEGKVVDEKGNEINVFSTNDSGSSIINFTPEKNRKYLFLYDHKTTKFPDFEEKGSYLKLEIEGIDYYKFKIYGSYKNLKCVDIVSKDGALVKRYQIPENGLLNVSVKDMQNNKLFALLLNENKEIIASRAFYPRAKNTIDYITLEKGKKTYGIREKVNLKLDAFNNFEELSVSVVKKCLVREDYKKSITNDDLLAAKSPNFIGYSKDILLPELEGEILTGRIINSISKKPIVDEEFVLNFVTPIPELKISTTDSLGRFKFIINRYGEEELVIQPLKEDSALMNYNVWIDEAYSQVYNDNSFLPFGLDSTSAKGINEAVINTQINAVYNSHIKDVAYVDSIGKTEAFFGKPNYTTIVDKYIELPTVEELVREVVPLTVVRKKNKSFHFIVKGDFSQAMYKGKTLTFWDGVLLRNIDEVIKLSPMKLKKVEVVDSKFFLHNIELGYLLCFYTKEGNMADIEFDSKIFRQIHKGYMNSYRFKGPAYQTQKEKESRLPDFRNTLYFNTFNKEDLLEPLNINFYTSDEETEFSIIIKGINKFGQVEEIKEDFIVTDL
ncbi:hypothetical protein [Marinifilum flexuosum]|uniref:hypothetical protein n=1 Tax=Marinifilum flexuosum TaxID=1117708 RepID=UPI00249555BB|nr:hypothetical protein [Marinifilum flexuosum]